MPGIVMFKRRWRVGSDDFVFPSCAELTIRVFWFAALLTEHLKIKHETSCQDHHWLQFFIKFSLPVLAFIIFLDILIVGISSRGTIVQDKPRHHLPKILYLRLLVMIAEIVWNAFGTKWAFTIQNHICDVQETVIFVQVISICSWILLCPVLLSILLVFDPNGSLRSIGSNHRVSDVERGEPQTMYINLNAVNIEKAKKVWEWQLRMFCCCRNEDEQSKSAYSAISKLLAQYFEEDLVPSDIAVGLILLQQKQSAESLHKASTSQQSESVSVQSPDSLTSTGAVQGSIISSPGVFSPPANQFWMSPEMASHFMKFALGSYGWPMFLYSNCFTGMCQIWKDMRCCSCICKPPSYIVDDNCCQCHTAALKYVTQLTDEDLIFVSFHNRVYEIPFYVAVDHQTCSVVVAIRGTLSLSDTLTDLTAECDKLFIEGCPQGLFCHRGMLQAAHFVKKKLEESHALSDAFALHQSYSLAITGHSLGAGSATLLALLLRPIYPNLRCFVFSPPGGLLSLEAVKYSEDFIMSVTLGDDIVPRLSVPTVEDLKKKLFKCIENCEKPKYKVFLHKLLNCFGKANNQETDSGSVPMSRPLLEHLGPTGFTSNYTNSGSQSSDGSVSSCHTTCQSKPSSHVPLYVPGRILHLTEADSSYQGRWVTADYFNQIIISPRMVSDHMPNAVYDALKQLVSGPGNFMP